MSELTEVTIDSLRVSMTNQHRVLLLKEKNGETYLPLYIGQNEAESILLALQDIECCRPLPHELLLSVVKSLNASVVFAEIVEQKPASLRAILVLRDGSGARIEVNCRPSDAITTVLHCHAPIYADSGLMLAAGIRPEADIRKPKVDSVSGSAENGDGFDLSVFENFFNDLDNKDGSGKDDDNSGKK